MHCAKNFLHFAQPGVYPNLLMMSCVIFHVPWHWAFFVRYERWIIPTQDWTWKHRARLLSKLQMAPTEKPLIASKPSDVVTSSINFAARDLFTSPSPLRATTRSSVWNRFPSHVPRCHLFRHHTSWNFPSNSEHHSSTEWQDFPSMWSFLQPLIRRFCRHSPHDICEEDPLHARRSTENTSERTETRLPTRLERSKKNHSCNLLN